MKNVIIVTLTQRKYMQCRERELSLIQFSCYFVVGVGEEGKFSSSGCGQTALHFPHCLDNKNIILFFPFTDSVHNITSHFELFLINNN